jgi:hypothetical protein
MKHLDAATLRSYRAKRLPPAGLLAADEHLAGCDECREELLGGEDGAAAGSLIDALTTEETGGDSDDEGEHLSYDTLEAWVDAKLSPREHRAASNHLQSCARCVGDLADLRDVATTMPRIAATRRGLSLRVAAVILLAVIGLASWLAMRHSRTEESANAPLVAAPLLTIHDGTSIINVDHDGSIHGMALSAADAAAVRAALMNGRIDVAPKVAGLQRERGTLMGTAAAAPFDVVMPVATFLRATRPQFSWTSAGNATYKVEVYDEARTLVLESPRLHDVAWTADRDLPRGHAYVWQVVATRDGERIVAPQPPAPEAHFGVVDDTAAARLDAAARSGSHLLLALTAAQEGVMDDARHELDTLARLNPGSSRVQRLAHSLTPATR